MADIEYPLLSLIQELIHLHLLILCAGDYLPARCYQLSANRLLADELGVVFDVGRRRHALDEIPQINRAADQVDLIPSLKLRRNGYRIGRLVIIEQLHDGGVDGLMTRFVEHLGIMPEDGDDLWNGIPLLKHRTQDGLLGLYVTYGFYPIGDRTYGLHPISP